MEKKTVKNIIFWQIFPSIHQASYIKKIQKYAEDVNVWCVFIRNIDSEREKLGWSLPDYGNVSLAYSTNKRLVRNILRDFDENSVHIFSGISSSYLIKYAFKRVQSQKYSLTAIMSEGYNIKGLKGFLKNIRRIIFDRRLYKHIDFVLAIGSKSFEWYSSCGITSDKIFSFPYVVDDSIETNFKDSAATDEYKIIFVGALIKRKNVAHLLYSLSKIRSISWSLSIVGDGPEKENLDAYAEALDIRESIKFIGVIDNREIRDYISRHDLFVLPSFWDGWGAVVNESISVGVPVICSDNCGSKELIIPGKNGDIFGLSDDDSLHKKLLKFLQRGPIDCESRIKIKYYAESISGETVARYFVDILNYTLTNSANCQKPTSPWKNSIHILDDIF